MGGGGAKEKSKRGRETVGSSLHTEGDMGDVKETGQDEGAARGHFHTVTATEELQFMA